MEDCNNFQTGDPNEEIVQIEDLPDQILFLLRNSPFEFSSFLEEESPTTIENTNVSSAIQQTQKEEKKPFPLRLWEYVELNERWLKEEENVFYLTSDDFSEGLKKAQVFKTDKRESIYRRLTEFNFKNWDNSKGNRLKDAQNFKIRFSHPYFKKSSTSELCKIKRSKTLIKKSSKGKTTITSNQTIAKLLTDFKLAAMEIQNNSSEEAKLELIELLESGVSKVQNLLMNAMDKGMGEEDIISITLEVKVFKIAENIRSEVTGGAVMIEKEKLELSVKLIGTKEKINVGIVQILGNEIIEGRVLSVGSAAKGLSLQTKKKGKFIVFAMVILKTREIGVVIPFELQ